MSGPESVQVNEGLVNDIIRGKSIRYQIVDLLDVTEFDFTTNDMKLLSDQDARLLNQLPDIVIAIVVNSKFVFGMNRIYASYLEGGSQMDNCDIFESMARRARGSDGKLQS